MATFDPIPQARVVRNGGQLVAPPRAPRMAPPLRARSGPPMREHVQNALAAAVGMWPLTAVVALMMALLYAATMAGAP